ncbi:MAG: outer membrane beta-barrel protein [Spirochaetes bacterium]|jgi:hypothetical protein|nr:outer membrane beta-barrel protein [Spirochaetota bacterium]
MIRSHAKTVRVILSAAVLFCAMALAPAGADAAARSFEEKEFDIGAAAGVWLPGTISIEDLDLDKSAGLLVRVFGDAYLMPKFAVGAYFNYSTATLEKNSIEVDATFWELGIALKPRFVLSPTVALKPGLNVGYRNSNRDRVAGFDDPDDDLSADGLGLNLSIELQILLEGGYIFFVEGGFLSQPAGGTDDVDVTWAPIMYLAGGVAF